MTIITISRGSYSRGKEIAESVADRMRYECLARDVLLETMDEFHIPEIKLVRAIHDAPRYGIVTLHETWSCGSSSASWR